jgi:protein transport protein SEC20
MPPIASPLFIEAQTTYEGLSRRLKDLNEYQIPRLRDCKGPLTLQQQFAAELRDDTETLAKRLEVNYLAKLSSTEVILNP